MTTITCAFIRKFNPCYDPSRHLAENYSAPLVDLLQLAHIPARDRIWLATRESVMSNRLLRLFAVRCARRALERVSDPDPRSIAACDVAERYANDEATYEELASADAAAYAAYATAAAAARSAAAYAAAFAARAAAARSAAAYAAADDAARVAADAAAAAFAAYARAAERNLQIQDLVELLTTNP